MIPNSGTKYDPIPIFGSDSDEDGYVCDWSPMSEVLTLMSRAVRDKVDANILKYLDNTLDRKDNKMKNTIVISAFPGAGKSYAFEHYKDTFTMLDSDNRSYSWIMTDNSKERNPDFPENYIQHIKENLGMVDFIFVSTHTTVRKALSEAGIDFFTVYPSNRATCKELWLKRLVDRGSDETFIHSIDTNWDSFMKEVTDGLYMGMHTIRILPQQGIDINLLDMVIEIYKDIRGGNLDANTCE